MHREPSIHITEISLVVVLKKLGQRNCEKLARDIVNHSKTLSCNSRGVYSSNNKIEKKIIKLQTSTRSDTSTFAQMLLIVRRQMKHRGITLIKPGSAEWFNLKEVCKMATDFSNEFELGIKTGYKEYLQIGMGKMKNFAINKFKSIHSAICNYYEAKTKILQDKTPSESERCHDIYMAIIQDKIGFAQGYRDNPEKYQYFVEVKREAKKLGIGYRDYMNAQFQGFEWNNSVPDPAQLVGVKALERLQRYAFEKNLKLGEKKATVNFKAIKKNGRDNRK